MPDPLPDALPGPLLWLRLPVAVLTILVTGGLITVLRLHWKAWRHLRRIGAPKAGLTPLHVALVSAGVLVSEVALAWGLIEQLRSDISPTAIIRVALYGVGALLILASLLVVGRVQRRTVRFERVCPAPATRVVVEPSVEPVPGGEER